MFTVAFEIRRVVEHKKAHSASVVRPHTIQFAESLQGLSEARFAGLGA
jgi:hypothetical protein